MRAFETFRPLQTLKGLIMFDSAVLRACLALNAMFSALSGAVLIFLPDAISGLLFTNAQDHYTLVLGIVGIGVLTFALAVAMLATNRHINTAWVRVVIFMDIAWVLASALTLCGSYAVFTDTGVVVISVVAACVAGFAAGQIVGLRRVKSSPSRAEVISENGLLSAHVRRDVVAPSDIVWRIITDHPGYADVADNLSRVELLSGDGLGMQRRCFGLKGEHWEETCISHQDGVAYAFRVHTDAEDYPYPISDLKGRWSVIQTESGAQFAIDIRARPSGNILQRTLFSLVAKRQFKTVLIDLADAWALRMESEAAAQ